jgi:hypothetical protein
MRAAAKYPDSTKTSLEQRLRARAGERWPQIASLQIRHRGIFSRQASGSTRQACPGDRPAGHRLMLALLEFGDVASAEQLCADGLVLARHAGDLDSQVYCLPPMAYMDYLAGRVPEGWVHLGESIEIASRVRHTLAILNCEDFGGLLCAATQRWAEAVTLWAALDAHTQGGGITDLPQDLDRRQASSGRPGKYWDPPGPAQPSSAAQR